MAVPSLGPLINPHETFQEISDLKVQTERKSSSARLLHALLYESVQSAGRSWWRCVVFKTVGAL